MSGTARKGFSKKYGQVFLRNREIAEFEADLLDSGSASILEIGPGEGFLTEVLLERGFNVVAVEPDHRLADYLTARFATHVGGKRLTILQKSV
ncbi:Ribosomal RNA adenine methylase transferase, partial [mine drainage metagenome]